MKHKDRKTIILEAVLAVIFIGIAGFYISRHGTGVLKLLASGNFEQLDEYLNKYGSEGKLLLILLQIVETLSIVLPAAPVYICSGIMFGKLKGVIVCYLTNLVLNVLIFRFSGLIPTFSHHSVRIENQKFIGRLIANATHMDRVVLCMCLLPVVPNGMIPYFSAQAKVTTPEFIRAIAIGSLPTIAMYTCCGDFLASDGYKIIIPIIIVLAILSVICLIFRKQLSAFAEPKLKQFLAG